MLRELTAVTSQRNMPRSTDAECPKCHNRWWWRNPQATGRDDRVIRCDCEGANRYWADYDRRQAELRERQEQERLERERVEAERRALCPHCGGHGYYIVMSDRDYEFADCTCTYGLGRRLERALTGGLVPARFQDARLENCAAEVRETIDGIDPRDGQGLLIYGPVGTGKTYLAVATMIHWLRYYQVRDIMFVPMPELLAEIRAGFADGARASDLLPRAMDCGLLVLDDLGTEKVTDWVRETQYMLINHRYNARLPVLCTTNMPPSRLAVHIGDRCASRLIDMCAVVKLNGPDRRLLKGG